jgi:hypothetical protein
MFVRTIRVKIEEKVRVLAALSLGGVIHLPTAGNESSFIAETSFVRAPLNSRVGATNPTPKSKGKEREDILDQLPTDIQEAIILEDLLYVLMVSDASQS